MVESHVAAYGAEVISDPMLVFVSSLNCTPATLTSSVAVAERAIAEPEIVALLAGAVMETEGAVVSEPIEKEIV